MGPVVALLFFFCFQPVIFWQTALGGENKLILHVNGSASETDWICLFWETHTAVNCTNDVHFLSIFNPPVSPLQSSSVLNLSAHLFSWPHSPPFYNSHPSLSLFCTLLFNALFYMGTFLIYSLFSPVFLSFRWTGLWISSSLTAAWTSTTACFRSCCSSNTWCGASGTSGFTSRGQVRRWRDKTLPVLHQLLIKYSCRRTLNSSYHLFIQSTVGLAVVKQ